MVTIFDINKKTIIVESSYITDRFYGMFAPDTSYVILCPVGPFYTEFGMYHCDKFVVIIIDFDQDFTLIDTDMENRIREIKRTINI